MRHDAIRNLYANAATIIDDQGVFDYDGNLVDIDENLVEQEVERLMQVWINQDYQRNRKREYPLIEDQLDILFHKGYDAWKETIQAVKDKYPKP